MKDFECKDCEDNPRFNAIPGQTNAERAKIFDEGLTSSLRDIEYIRDALMNYTDDQLLKMSDSNHHTFKDVVFAGVNRMVMNQLGFDYRGEFK